MHQQDADLRGAHVTNVDSAILDSIEAAKRSATCKGIVPGAGSSLDNPVWLILTGDGAGLTDQDSGVRVVIQVSYNLNRNLQTPLNIFLI